MDQVFFVGMSKADISTGHILAAVGASSRIFLSDSPFGSRGAQHQLVG